MILSPDVVSSLVPAVQAAAREAGAMALAYFRRDATTTAEIWSKAGGSPVTAADLAVDAFLKVRLSSLLPKAGWLSEETVDDPARLRCRNVWVVDPIDGTRAFMRGHPDWSVVIALVADGRPVLGVLDAPAHGLIYEATAGGGARRNGMPIAVSTRAVLAGAGATGPNPLVDKLDRAAGGIARLDRIPSLALRLARVAEGSVECGLISGNAHDWDIAASDLILDEAGGLLTAFDGAIPAYNGIEPIHGELLAASRQLHPLLIEAMRD